MKKINYRIAVNINGTTMKLGFRCKLPLELTGYRVRVQALFSQRQVDRRFPMEAVVEETDIGLQVRADAEIELPYVFYRPPRNKVALNFVLWYGTNEMILDDQPFPVQKEMFARAEAPSRRNVIKFALCTLGLPFLMLKNYFAEEKDMERAKKRANEAVYHVSGYSYSPRQRHTDYFAVKYEKYCAKRKELSGNKVLFLSERLPEQGGNLQLVRQKMEEDPAVEVMEFISTETVDKLTKSELRQCARKCAEASVIILEDFYPQLHRLSIRSDTKVVQLWHACGAFKTFGLSRMGKQGGAPQSSMNHRNYDLVPVSSEEIRGIYAEAFALPTSKVQALGVPRTDCLFDPEYKTSRREQIYEKYPALREKKVILFAPTFRGDGNKDAHYPRDAFSIDAFMREMPENVALIVKHHPFVRPPEKIPDKWEERALDLTGKDHINDLMLVSDLLITDYSSSIFEAALLGLPTLFYAFDQDEYINTRDFYFEYESMAPGPVEITFQGVIRQVRKMLQEPGGLSRDESKRTARGPKRVRQFRGAFLGTLDGHSTERICNYIKGHYLSQTQSAPKK